MFIAAATAATAAAVVAKRAKHIRYCGGGVSPIVISYYYIAVRARTRP